MRTHFVVPTHKDPVSLDLWFCRIVLKSMGIAAILIIVMLSQLIEAHLRFALTVPKP